MNPTSWLGLYGIGDLGPEAERFLEWLAAAGQGARQQVLSPARQVTKTRPTRRFGSAGYESSLLRYVVAAEGLIRQSNFRNSRRPATTSIDYGDVIRSPG